MRRALALAAAVLAVLAAGAHAGGGRIAQVGVGLQEFRVSLYRTAVPRGTVSLNLHNYGQDVHDLAIRSRGRVLAETAVIKPGANATLRARLRPGRYQLVCLIADHARRGMRAWLTVRR